MTSLRPYQSAAVDALLASFERRGRHNPLVVVPTGGGKSAILAGFLDRALASSPTSRALVLAHRKELLEQDARAILRFAPGLDVGIYSAGLGLRQAQRRVVVGGVQSVVGNIEALGARDLVIVDEAHLVPHSDDGMYREVLSTLGDPATVGLTATPYRLSGGHLCRGKDRLFSHIAHEVTIAELLALGHLAPLTTKPTDAQYSTSNVSTRNGEFMAKDLAISVGLQSKVTENALAEAVSVLTAMKRRHWLIFAVGVDHAREVMQILFSHGVGAAVITADTPSGERAATIECFRRGDLTALINVDVLTTGFDAPLVDAIVLLRPTQSTGLYVQILGRGMRPADGKKDCLVLDYGGNVARHGPVDAVRPKSSYTPGAGAIIHVSCGAEIPARAAVCAECGELVEPRRCGKCGELNRRDRRECATCGADLRTPREIEHDEKAASLAVMGGEDAREQDKRASMIPVSDTRYSKHEKKQQGANGEELESTFTVRVDYHGQIRKICSEWVCPEHLGFAKSKADKWWRARGGLGFPPNTVDEFLARTHELPRVLLIATSPDPKNEKYTRVTDFVLGERGEKPVEIEAAPVDAFDEWASGPEVLDDGELPF